jgi:hypothetical protein
LKIADPYYVWTSKGFAYQLKHTYIIISLTLLPLFRCRYEPGQALAPHYDANQGDSKEEMGEMGQTLATVLVYLNDVPEGIHMLSPLCVVSTDILSELAH